MNFKRIMHDNFKRTKAFENVKTRQQYPVLDDDDGDLRYLIPNIEYPFSAYRLVITDAKTGIQKYVSPNEERFRKRLLKFPSHVYTVGLTESPTKAMIFSTDLTQDGKENIIGQLTKLREIIQSSPTLFPKSCVDDLDVDAVFVTQDQTKFVSENELAFLLCITVRGNTFTLISPKPSIGERWKFAERGYKFSLSSCLYRSTWKWHRRNLMDLDGFCSTDKYLGLLKEARKCIKNHPLCARFSEITGEGRPGIYILDPYTFKVLRGWDFTRLVDNTSGHVRSKYRTTTPTIYGLEGERW